jgi:sulfite reductase alpha subunit-like flavoprotein
MESAFHSHCRFAVFALGSSAYPNVCAFGRNLDYSFNLLGGQQLIDVPCGDELSGQEKTFRKWTHTVYRVTQFANFNFKSVAKYYYNGCPLMLCIHFKLPGGM